MKYAFRCRGCGRLHTSGDAGEAPHPHSCKVCGRGVVFELERLAACLREPDISPAQVAAIADQVAKCDPAEKQLDPDNWDILAQLDASPLSEFGLTPDNVDRHVPRPATEPGRAPKALSESVTDSLGLSEHLRTEQERPDRGMIGYSETERRGLAASASVREDGLVAMSLIGESPQNEQDTPNVCQVLMERLNRDGARWSNVTPGDVKVDGAFADEDDPKRVLEVQVVRAIVSQDLWRTLNSAGSVQALLSPAAAAGELRAAIEKKATVPKHWVLALDATRLAGLAFDDVVREFHANHTAWAASLGLAAIWLVGPTPRLVWRLDR